MPSENDQQNTSKKTLPVDIPSSATRGGRIVGCHPSCGDGGGGGKVEAGGGR